MGPHSLGPYSSDPTVRDPTVSCTHALSEKNIVKDLIFQFPALTRFQLTVSVDCFVYMSTTYASEIPLDRGERDPSCTWVKSISCEDCHNDFDRDVQNHDFLWTYL